MENTTNKAIKNHPDWLPHSHVLLKGLWLMEDNVWAANNSEAQGDFPLRKIERMVVSGLVAVVLKDGTKHEVRLPGEAGKLRIQDINYIIAQIDANGDAMTAQEYQDFLASAAAQSPAS